MTARTYGEWLDQADQKFQRLGFEPDPTDPATLRSCFRRALSQHIADVRAERVADDAIERITVREAVQYVVWRLLGKNWLEATDEETNRAYRFVRSNQLIRDHRGHPSVIIAELHDVAMKAERPSIEGGGISSVGRPSIPPALNEGQLAVCTPTSPTGVRTTRHVAPPELDLTVPTSRPAVLSPQSEQTAEEAAQDEELRPAGDAALRDAITAVL